MKFRILLLILLYVLFQAPISAQLTIGSATEPLSGVLLDIKNSTDGYSDKGLLLPRVQLKNRDSLTPLLTESGAKNADSLAYHRGLTVYNLTKSDNLCPGVYTWNGQLWMEFNAMKESVYQGDTQSNSFIVPINTIIDIPVEKAYRFWAEYQTPPLAKNTFPNKKLSELSPGVVKAVLLWEDSPGLVSNVSSVDNHLFLRQDSISAVIGEGQNAFIRVEPRLNKCDDTLKIEGNAVVALSIDDTIYWSWHIWYTNYNPNQIIDTLSSGAYGVEHGKIYEYDNQISDKTIIFMDRNLGALSSTPGDKRSIGLRYQWGRKDPYPGFVDFNTDTLQNIYNAKDGDIPLNNNITEKETQENLNLPNAIYNPMTIYIGGRGYSYNDWYTSVTDGASGRYLNLSYQNDYLWNNQGKKTYFDPCPKGWRVPDISSWFNSQAVFNPSHFNLGWDYVEASDPRSCGGSYNNGWIFNNPDYNIGYYPLTKGGSNIGQYHTSSVFGESWSFRGSQVNEIMLAYCMILEFTPTSINIKDPGRETLGALRCVQE